MNEPLLADFDVVCTDGVRLSCSRKVLEDRWPWFRQQLETYTTKIKHALYGKVKSTNGVDPDGKLVLSPHELLLSEDEAVGTAILQYFYTLNLITPLQRSLPILVPLLLFAKEYDITHLRALAVHAFHELLTHSHASPALVYEAATLGGCIALQTRALKLMMNVRSFPLLSAVRAE